MWQSRCVVCRLPRKRKKRSFKSLSFTRQCQRLKRQHLRRRHRHHHHHQVVMYYMYLVCGLGLLFFGKNCKELRNSDLRRNANALYYAASAPASWHERWTPEAFTCLAGSYIFVRLTLTAIARRSSSSSSSSTCLITTYYIYYLLYYI